MLMLHTADYVVFGVILFISAMIGPWEMWKGRNKLDTSSSYFGGDRHLHFIPTSASLFASFYSAIALVGLPAEVYMGGAFHFTSVFSEIIGISLSAIFVVPLVYNLKLISIFEYFELRFHSRALRLIGNIANMIAFILYLAVATYAPCAALQAVSPIPLEVAIFVTAGVTMIYTVLGGIRAVVFVDLLQAIVMFGGVLACLVIGFSKIDGGLGKVWEVAEAKGRTNFFDFNPDPTRTYNFYIMSMAPIFTNVAIYAASQPTVQRYSALPTVTQAKWSVLTLLPQIFCLRVLLLFLSWVIFAYYDIQGCDPLRGKLIESPNQLTTFFIADVIQIPGLVGLWFSALFSGSLSSMSTGYNSLAACMWEDLLKQRIEHRLSSQGVSVVIKLISFGFAVITAFLALMFKYFQGSVVQMSSSTVHVFAGSNIIAFFTGVFCAFVNAIGTVFGMAVAPVVVAIFSAFRVYYEIPNGLVVNETTIDNCTEMLSNLIEAGKHANVTLAPFVEYTPRYEDLPDWIFSTLSVSHFLLGFICLVLGILIAIVISLVTGGLKQAKHVSPSFLIFPNCFADKNDYPYIKGEVVDQIEMIFPIDLD